MPFLLLLGDDERIFPLHRRLRIGRSPDQNIVLQDAAKSVSRAHAELLLIDGRAFLIDLGSRNGTRLDGRPVPSNERCPVDPGASIELGYYQLRYLADPPSTPPPTILGETRPMLELRDAPTPDAAPSPARARLQQLYQLNRALHGAQDPQALLERFAAVLQATFTPERLFIGLHDPGIDGWTHSHASLQRGRDRGAFRLSPALMALVRRDRKAFLTEEVPLEAAPGALALTRSVRRIAMCCPLLGDTDPIGMLYLDDRHQPGRFSPDDLEHLSLLGLFLGRLLAGALEQDRLRRRMEALEAGSSLVFGRTPAMQDLQRRLLSIASTRLPVLLLGETGTGKSSLALELHRQSAQRDGPFVKVNCAAIPETLLEAELFGYAPRSGIANADPKGRPGKFEQAHDGTLFLDEIGDMPLSQQAKLLSVLEDREVYRLGAVKPTPVNVRVVAATARPLEVEVRDRRFRDDLYHRLSRAELTVPPLRDRRDDLPDLVTHLIDRLRQDIPKRILGVSPEALEAMRAYNWPGNIRELENSVAQAMLECPDGGSLLRSHLPAKVEPPGLVGTGGVRVRLVRDSEALTEEERSRREALVAAILETGSLTRAAAQLGMSKQWAIELSRRLGVQVGRG